MEVDSLLGARWPALLAGLPASFDLAATARGMKAFVRPRGVRCGEDLLRLGLAYGLGKLSLRSTAVWAEATALARLSDVAVLGRLRNAADWFEALARALLAEQLAVPVERWKGYRLRLVDATTVSQPGSTGTDWRLHVAYDLDLGGLTAVTLTDEHGGESLGRFAAGAGDLVIGDRGYAKAADLHALCQQGADLIVRIGWNALRLTTEAGESFELFKALRTLPAQEAAAYAVVVQGGGRMPFRQPLRLVAKRKTPEAAERSRRQLQQRSKKKGRPLDPRSLEAAGYIFAVTSLPAARFSAEAVLTLYQLRWQIELAFKRLKSLMQIEALTAKDPRLVKAWLFCNVIAALLIESLARQVRDSFPSRPRGAAGRGQSMASSPPVSDRRAGGRVW